MTRSKSGIALTNYGEHLLPYVNAVLNSDESLKQVIAEFNGLKQGKVKIGVCSSVCTNWLPDILQERELNIKWRRSRALITLLVRGSFSCRNHKFKVLQIGLLLLSDFRQSACYHSLPLQSRQYLLLNQKYLRQHLLLRLNSHRQQC